MSNPHPASPSTPRSGAFQTGRIATIILGHTIHDSFAAFFAPLLPLIQEKLAISYSRIGFLSFGLQMPFISTLLLGYLADRLSVRYFVILAPAVTATFMSLLGLVPSYWMLMTLTVIAGFSIAAFHAPSPAMISQISGRRVGLGMSLFMGSGELGRTVGPLLIAWGVAAFTLEGTWRLMALGWIISGVLYWRLRTVPARPVGQGSPDPLRKFWLDSRHLMTLLLFMMIFRTFIHVALTTYLPLYMRDILGAEFAEGARSLAVLEGAGVLGALLAGTLADHYSRKNMLLGLFVISSLLVALFLVTPVERVYWVLPLVGFFNLSTTPVLLTVLQTRFPGNRALASATFMAMGVFNRGFITWILGVVADRFDLAVVFWVCIAVSMLGIIPLLMMRRADVEVR